MDGRLFATGCLLVPGCAALAVTLPATYPTLAVVGLVGVALAAAAVLDDAAAAVTDATPRTARRRMLGQAPLALGALAVWIGTGALLELRDHEWPFLFAAAIGFAVVTASFGFAAAARRAGIAQPGEAVGTAVGAVVLAALLAAPSVRGVSPFFPEPAALWWWLPVFVGGSGALVVGTRDRVSAMRSGVANPVGHRHPAVGRS